MIHQILLFESIINEVELCNNKQYRTNDLYYTKILNNYLAIFNVQCTRMIRGIEFNKIVINV